MARVIGSQGSGFATVAPTENYVGEAIQNNEANAFKYREEQRDQLAKKAALQKARQDALDKQRDQDIQESQEFSKVKIPPSGLKGIDSFVHHGAANARKEGIEARRNYAATGDPKYLQDYNIALSKLNTISQAPKLLADTIANLRQGVNNGSYDKEELDRIEQIGNQIDSGEVVPTWDKANNMYLSVYGVDPQTGQLSNTKIKDIPGEEFINMLTPEKKFDLNKHVEDVQGLFGSPVTNYDPAKKANVTSIPNLKQLVKNQADILLKDENLLRNVAKSYGVLKEAGKDFTPEQKQAVYDQYSKQLASKFHEGEVPNLVIEKHELSKRKEARLAQKDIDKENENKYTPTVSTVKKGNFDPALGFRVDTGDKIINPFYPKGKTGPIKAVVIKPNGTYEFSISERKSDDLNAKGQLNKKAFESKEENAGKEYEPIDSDYTFSLSKPTKFVSGKDNHIINRHLSGVINPETGKYFTGGIQEYNRVYNKLKPKTQSTPAKKPAQTKTKAKVYAGVDENGKIIWK